MGDGRPGTGGTAGTVASGARGTGRGGVSTRRGACAVPGGGKDEKLFAKDIGVRCELCLPAAEAGCLFAATINAIGSCMAHDSSSKA